MDGLIYQVLYLAIYYKAHHCNKIVMLRVFTIHKTISLPAERILKSYIIHHFELVME